MTNGIIIIIVLNGFVTPLGVKVAQIGEDLFKAAAHARTVL
jgi:hypothetical protein